MKDLPNTVRAYSRSPDFNAQTVPAGLTRDHNTKSGVWGVINVIEGTIEYVIPSLCERHSLSSAKCGIVEPEVPHHVVLAPDAKFYVEFYR